MGIMKATTTFKISAKTKKIVLVGNPNVGKSVFFNALTDRYVEVSNFPGTKVDINHRPLGGDVLIDTPGIYGVSSFNDEEKVAREMILQADVVIDIVDALHLERDLFLTQQLIDMEIPMVVALNMMDEARRRGVEIDVPALENYLGVPVIPTVAIEGKGIEELKKTLDKARIGHKVPEIAAMLALVKDFFPTTGESLLYLEEDPLIEASGSLLRLQRNQSEPESPGLKMQLRSLSQIQRNQEEMYLKRRLWVNEIVKKVIKEGTEGATFAARLGHLLLRPFPGIPALLLSLLFMYYFVGVLIAQVLVEFTEGVVMESYYSPLMENIIGRIFPLGTAFGYILAGEYGILTMTVVYVFGLLMPLVAGFYFVLSIMEDSGYLPRVATLTDRILVKMCLNGRAIIPKILGLGCVTMATITTRILGSGRERIIATALLGIAIPCSAQLGVIFGMVAPLGLSYLVLYLSIIGLIFIGVGIIMDKFIPGRSTDLLIDLPPLRLPQLKNVLKKTYTRTVHFLKEALPLFALGALLISLLNISGLLHAIQN